MAEAIAQASGNWQAKNSEVECGSIGESHKATWRFAQSNRMEQAIFGFQSLAQRS